MEPWTTIVTHRRQIGDAEHVPARLLTVIQPDDSRPQPVRDRGELRSRGSEVPCRHSLLPGGPARRRRGRGRRAALPSDLRIRVPQSNSLSTVALVPNTSRQPATDWQPATREPGELFTPEGRIRAAGAFARGLKSPDRRLAAYRRSMIRAAAVVIAIGGTFALVAALLL
jgi:hypothetical protein